MKPNKWSRLGLGLALLAMLAVFQGTMYHEADPMCWLCEAAAAGSGYLEVHNNTPYNIKIIISGPNRAGPYVIKTTPSFLRKMLENGRYRVLVSVIEPLTQRDVFYRGYDVDVPPDMQTVVLPVTTPINYIPVPR